MKKENIKKIPWGIVCGIAGMLVFYLTAGIIGSYAILNSIAAQTHETASMFGTWWQTLIFLLDIVFLLCLLFSLGMYVYLKIKAPARTEEITEA